MVPTRGTLASYDRPGSCNHSATLARCHSLSRSPPSAPPRFSGHTDPARSAHDGATPSPDPPTTALAHDPHTPGADPAPESNIAFYRGPRHRPSPVNIGDTTHERPPTPRSTTLRGTPRTHPLPLVHPDPARPLARSTKTPHKDRERIHRSDSTCNQIIPEHNIAGVRAVVVWWGFFSCVSACVFLRMSAGIERNATSAAPLPMWLFGRDAVHRSASVGARTIRGVCTTVLLLL